MKKIKFVGHPCKIFKKTAFIKDMFNSDLEIAKYEGAAVQTVSKIRGEVKKVIFLNHFLYSIVNIWIFLLKELWQTKNARVVE